MPEITPDLIRKHFRCPYCLPKTWDSRLNKLLKRYPSFFVPHLARETGICAQGAVEFLIMRLEKAEIASRLSEKPVMTAPKKPSWNSSETANLVRKHFVCPYPTMQDDWNNTLEMALNEGCDWLHVMQSLNPIPAEAVERLIQRLDAAEKRIEELEAETVKWKPKEIKASK